MGTGWTITANMRNNLRNGIAYCRPVRKIWSKGMRLRDLRNKFAMGKLRGINPRQFLGLITLSKKTKAAQARGAVHNVGKYIKENGMTFEHKQKMSNTALKRPRILCKCGKTATKAMFMRWHASH